MLRVCVTLLDGVVWNVSVGGVVCGIWWWFSSFRFWYEFGVGLVGGLLGVVSLLVLSFWAGVGFVMRFLVI